jgi:hypothetical protein
LPPIPPPRPGHPNVILRAPKPTNQVALTIDDGYRRECVAGYVAFAERTGIQSTFSPNGRFGDVWRPRMRVLRPLIAARGRSRTRVSPALVGCIDPLVPFSTTVR